jgi:hypothetical protein
VHKANPGPRTAISWMSVAFSNAQLSLGGIVGDALIVGMVAFAKPCASGAPMIATATPCGLKTAQMLNVVHLETVATARVVLDVGAVALATLSCRHALPTLFAHPL